MRLIHGLLIVSSFTVLAACGSRQEVEPEPIAQAEPPPVEEPAEDPAGVQLAGDHITIDRHINFENASATILATSDELLDNIATVIQNHPDEVTGLRIIGHTSSVGSDRDNQTLSERRAASVEQALRSRGVQIPLEHIGAGETRPLCEDEVEECHARNRRVEFLIIEPTAGGEEAAD